MKTKTGYILDKDNIIEIKYKITIISPAKYKNRDTKIYKSRIAALKGNIRNLQSAEKQMNASLKFYTALIKENNKQMELLQKEINDIKDLKKKKELDLHHHLLDTGKIM